jgi:hypoxanthine phosphoribosyltransferase
MEEASLELLYSPERIRRRIDELAERINNDYKGKDVLAVCVLKGAFMFFAELMKRFSFSPLIDFVRLSSYGKEVDTSGNIQLAFDLQADVRDRHVLIIEDIVDTGLTMAFLRRHLEEKGAKTLRIAALIDKVERRRTAVQVDYVGFSLAEGFIVGFGLDYAERYRELNGIYTLTPAARRAGC